MSIDEAAVKLAEHLHCAPGGEDEGVFIIRPEGNEIVVDVNFIYRVKDVPEEFEGLGTVGPKSGEI